LLITTIDEVIKFVQANHWLKASQITDETSKVLHRKVRPYRHATLNQVASGQIDVLTGTSRLEAIRWLRRTSKHIARITGHMSQSTLSIGKLGRDIE
jgi:phosphate:Na+ symporter